MSAMLCRSVCCSSLLFILLINVFLRLDLIPDIFFRPLKSCRISLMRFLLFCRLILSISRCPFLDDSGSVSLFGYVYQVFVWKRKNYGRWLPIISQFSDACYTAYDYGVSRIGMRCCSSARKITSAEFHLVCSAATYYCSARRTNLVHSPYIM